MEGTLRRIYYNPNEDSVKSERYFKLVGITYVSREYEDLSKSREISFRKLLVTFDPNIIEVFVNGRKRFALGKIE